MRLAILTTGLMCLVVGREVAYVDLTSSHKTTESGDQTISVRGIGGLLYHGNAPHPLPGTPAISLKLNRIITSVDTDGIAKKAIEVLATNTGKDHVSIPIGTDSVPLLKSPGEDRRYLSFTVTLGNNLRIGSGESASNRDHPESSIVLQPGDQAAFLLPIYPPYGNHREDEITVSAHLFRKVMEKGKDWTEAVGGEIHSENTLPQ